MRNKTPFQISTLSAAIASTLFSGYVASQDILLEEVIVTATRRAQSLQDIPINITALSEDTILRDRITDLTDIARVVPGMTVIDQGPRSASTLTVRGLSTSSITATDQSNNGGGTVGTYVGEIPLYVDLKLNDMERVEVLMGPQGTLYGAGTLGGAVRYLPNRPQADALSYQVRGDLYSLDHSSDAGYEGGGTVNIPIIDDKLAFRASVDYLDDPGFIDYNYLVREPGVSNPQPDFNDPNDVNANLKKRKMPIRRRPGPTALPCGIPMRDWTQPCPITIRTRRSVRARSTTGMLSALANTRRHTASWNQINVKTN
jgi:iron complex outermembrane receptor protein